jgi:hypothetical protein
MKRVAALEATGGSFLYPLGRRSSPSAPPETPGSRRSRRFFLVDKQRTARSLTILPRAPMRRAARARLQKFKAFIGLRPLSGAAPHAHMTIIADGNFPPQAAF